MRATWRLWMRSTRLYSSMKRASALFSAVISERRILTTSGSSSASREADDEPLVVKILRSEITAENKALARFMEEYSLVERIQSRHVARIHDHGTVDGHTYLVMEFFEGGDLSKRLADKAVAPDEALRIF